jgi:hypothetical protein
VVFFICTLGAFLTLPPAAEAKPGYKVRPGGTELWILLEDKGDYEFMVEANDRQRVLLAVEQSLLAGTEYSTKGRVSSKRIEADFGELGQIDIEVRLRPGRSYSFPPSKNCKGPATINVPGSFRGTIEYAGEGDIPPFSVKRGEIEFVRRFKRVCKQQSAPGQGEKKRKVDVGILEAFSEVEGRTTFFGAVNHAPRRNPAHSFGFLAAGAFARSEGVLIERSAPTFFGHESFRMSERGKKPVTVKVKPPEPLAGRALYSHKPGSPPRWSGNLVIDLPGAKPIPLAGPEFKAAFCRGPSLTKAESCLRDVNPLYGSGSHSQPLALARFSSLR